jgi:hypothetical protein
MFYQLFKYWELAHIFFRLSGEKQILHFVLKDGSFVSPEGKKQWF